MKSSMQIPLVNHQKHRLSEAEIRSQIFRLLTDNKFLQKASLVFENVYIDAEAKKENPDQLTLIQ